MGDTVRMNLKSIRGSGYPLNVKTRNCIRKSRYERLPFQPICINLLSLLGAVRPFTQSADEPIKQRNSGSK